MAFVLYYCVLIVLSIATKQASAEILEIRDPTVTGIYNETVQLTFHVNFTGHPNKTLESFIVKLPDSDKNLAVELNSKFVVETNAEPYRDRLRSGSQGYNLFIDDLKWTDERTFIAKLIYKDENTNTPKTIEKNVTLVVKGGPYLCGPQVPSNITFDLSSDNYQTVTICGNEKPLVVFDINGTALTSLNSYNTSNIHEYVYNVTIPKGDVSVCGKRLSYLATGKQSDLKGSSLIDVIFKPSVTISSAMITSDYQSNNCIEVTWDKIDTGSCTDLKYDVQLVKNNGNTTNLPSVNHTITYAKHCVTDYTGLVNVTSVSVKATFKGTVGDWSEQAVVFPTTTTTTTTTTTPTTTKKTTPTTTPNSGGLKNDDDDNDIYIIVGAVVGGCAFLIILILIIVCCCCRKKKQKKEGIKDLHLESVPEFDYKKVDEDQQQQGKTDSKFKVPPASTIHHPSKLIENKNATGDSPDMAIHIEVDEPVTNENAEQQKQNDDTVKQLDVKNDDDDEPHEVVSAAQLKYYDPTEFDLPPTQGQQDEVGKKPALEFTNEGYGKDEFDSDNDEHDYENYHENYKADQLPSEAYEHYDGEESKPSS